MPDIDNLMQEWPGEVEELLKEINLPTAKLEGDLSQYVDLICGNLILINLTLPILSCKIV